MELLGELRSFDGDDLMLIKLSLKLNLLTQEQLRELIENSSGKQMVFALCDSGLLSTAQISELLRLRENSIICPHCQSLNLLPENTDSAFCKECRQFLKSNATTRRADFIRQKYGKYKIVELIGNGSVGLVYQAEHEDLGRLVALKVLKTEELNDNILLRFKQEARAVASLNHPAIVSIYDVGDECGEHYIAMEYVAGHSLAYVLKNQRPSLQQKVEIIAQICQGLQHAHDNKIIHRDIKPENIMISNEGQAKITDFGLARKMSQEVRITQPNIIMGTPLYMSPEQITGDEIGPASDIYALGVVFYEMLVGKPPFDHSVTTTLMQMILTESPIPPRQRKSSIPKILEDICLKAIEKEESKRYHSAQEMYQSLRQFLNAKRPVSSPSPVRKMSLASRESQLPSTPTAPLPNPARASQFETMKESKPERRSMQELMATGDSEDDSWSYMDLLLWGMLALALFYLCYRYF